MESHLVVDTLEVIENPPGSMNVEKTFIEIDSIETNPEDVIELDENCIDNDYTQKDMKCSHDSVNFENTYIEVDSIEIKPEDVNEVDETGIDDGYKKESVKCTHDLMNLENAYIEVDSIEIKPEDVVEVDEHCADDGYTTEDVKYPLGSKNVEKTYFEVDRIEIKSENVIELDENCVDDGYTPEGVKYTHGSGILENTCNEVDRIETTSDEVLEVDENWVVIDEAVDEEEISDTEESSTIIKAKSSDQVKDDNKESQLSEPLDNGRLEKRTNALDDENADPFYCVACNIQCEDGKSYFMHTRGMMHTLNAGAAAGPQIEIAKESGQTCEDKSRGDQDGNEIDQEEEDFENCQESWLAFKGESDTFYCEVCECSMNSVQNYETHLKGARHLKNTKNRASGVPIKKPKGKSAFGNHLAKIVDREPVLQPRITQCKEPLIGLQYVTEFCHVDSDFEPVYACNLCESKCDARMIIYHLTGFKHRYAYMKKHHVNYAVLTQNGARKSDMTAVAETYAGEIEAKEGRQKVVVRLETDFTNGSGLDPSEYNTIARKKSRSVSPRSDRSSDRRESRKRRRHRSRSYDSPHRHRSSRRSHGRRSRSRSRSRSGDRHRSRRRSRSSEDRRDRRYHDRRERDYRDRDRYEHGYPRPGFEAPYYRLQYPPSHGIRYGMNAPPFPAGYALPSTALPPAIVAPPAVLSQFTEYRASMSLTNSAPPLSHGFSNMVAYPLPRASYGGPTGYQSMLPAPPMVPPVSSPPAPAVQMPSYYLIPPRASSSLEAPKSDVADTRPSLPSSRIGSSTLSSVVSRVSANIADDSEEAGAISKVIAEAILKYKLEKAQEKTKYQMSSNRY